MFLQRCVEMRFGRFAFVDFVLTRRCCCIPAGIWRSPYHSTSTNVTSLTRFCDSPMRIRPIRDNQCRQACNLGSKKVARGVREMPLGMQQPCIAFALSLHPCRDLAIAIPFCFYQYYIANAICPRCYSGDLNTYRSSYSTSKVSKNDRYSS